MEDKECVVWTSAELECRKLADQFIEALKKERGVAPSTFLKISIFAWLMLGLASGTCLRDLQEAYEEVLGVKL